MSATETETKDIPLSEMRHRQADPNLRDEEESSIIPTETSLPAQNYAPKREVVEALNSYPDGGWYAWFQIACCFILFGTTAGSFYSWGVIQEALVSAKVSNSGTLAMVGSTQIIFEFVLAVLFARLVKIFGPARVSLVGSVLVGAGPIICGFFSKSVPILFFGQGVVFGTGNAMIFWSTSPLASSYFYKRRNLATGIVYSGGPFGAAIWSVVASKFINKFGIDWTFRALGIIWAAINLPASYFLDNRLPRGKHATPSKIVEWSYFKDVSFVLLVAGTALSTFQLFVPAFFIPTYGTAIGLTPSVSSLLLLAYNLSSAAGRIFFGLSGDRLLGSVNSVLVCLFSGAVSCLLIWPLARTFGPLLLFSIIGGATTGGFFSLMPGVVSALFGSSKLPVLLSMIVFTWTPGNIMGSAIAGYIIQACGGTDNPDAFRPAMFYTGSISLISAVIVYAARFTHSPGMWKKL